MPLRRALDRLYDAAAWVAAVMMVGVLVMVLRPVLPDLFTDDPAVIALATFLRRRPGALLPAALAHARPFLVADTEGALDRLFQP